MNLIERSRQASHEGHDAAKQKRKWTGEPYWVHTDEVAELVSQVIDNEHVIAAANAHDLGEDVIPLGIPGYTNEWLLSVIGPIAFNYVVELTDIYTKEAFPHLNRTERKKLEAQRLGECSIEAKSIKLADLCSNTRSIVSNDRNFARTYIREKLQLLSYLSDGNSTLLGMATDIAVKSAKELDMVIPTINPR